MKLNKVGGLFVALFWGSFFVMLASFSLDSTIDDLLRISLVILAIAFASPVYFSIWGATAERRKIARVLLLITLVGFALYFSMPGLSLLRSDTTIQNATTLTNGAGFIAMVPILVSMHVLMFERTTTADRLKGVRPWFPKKE